MKHFTYSFCCLVLFIVSNCTSLSAQTDNSVTLIEFLRKNIPELLQYEKTLVNHTISTGDTVTVVYRVGLMIRITLKYMLEKVTRPTT